MIRIKIRGAHDFGNGLDIRQQATYATVRKPKKRAWRPDQKSPNSRLPPGALRSS